MYPPVAICIFSITPRNFFAEKYWKFPILLAIQHDISSNNPYLVRTGMLQSGSCVHGRFIIIIIIIINLYILSLTDLHGVEHTKQGCEGKANSKHRLHLNLKKIQVK